MANAQQLYCNKSCISEVAAVFPIIKLQHTSKLIKKILISLSYKTSGKKTNMTNAQQLYCIAVFLKLEA